MKIHHLGLSVPKTIPKPLHFQLSPASANDNTIFKEQIAPNYQNLRVYADKIYHDQAAEKELCMETMSNPSLGV